MRTLEALCWPTYIATLAAMLVAGPTSWVCWAAAMVATMALLLLIDARYSHRHDGRR